MKKTVFYWGVLSSLVIFIITGFLFFRGSGLSAESEKILAKIGEKIFITQNDLDELMKRYEQFRKGTPYTLDEKKDMVNLLIQNTLISQEAEKQRLGETPEIKSKLKMYKNDLLIREYVKIKVEPFVSVKNEEVDEIMKKNPQLIPKEMLTLKEIVVKTEKEAEEVYQELKKGVDFSKIASEKSTAPSKTKGGLIGTVQKGQFPPSEEAIFFNLKEGEFSKPAKVEGGFKIFYLMSKQQRTPQEIKALEGKFREKILQLEKGKKIEAIMEKKIEELMKQSRVETYLDRLK